MVLDGPLDGQCPGLYMQWGRIVHSDGAIVPHDIRTILEVLRSICQALGFVLLPSCFHMHLKRMQ